MVNDLTPRLSSSTSLSDQNSTRLVNRREGSWSSSLGQGQRPDAQGVLPRFAPLSTSGNRLPIPVFLSLLWLTFPSLLSPTPYPLNTNPFVAMAFSVSFTPFHSFATSRFIYIQQNVQRISTRRRTTFLYIYF